MQTMGGVPAILITLAVGTLMGLINGVLIVLTRVPDIVVTLAMLFVWEGTALLILNSPGGIAAPFLREAIAGSVLIHGLPKALILMAIIVAVIWVPLKRSKAGARDLRHGIGRERGLSAPAWRWGGPRPRPTRSAASSAPLAG